MKAMVGLVITVLLVFLVTLFWPSASIDRDMEVKQDDVSKPANAGSGSAEVAEAEAVLASEEKAARMKAEYEKLEQARKELKRHLARLKHEMWGMKFPPKQASDINEIMLNAHKFEKTPRMLGAFMNVEEISAELEKVRFAIRSLEELETMLEQTGETAG